MRQTIKIHIFIQIFSFMLIVFISSLVYAYDIEKPPALSTDSLRDVKDEEQFKKAVNLINSKSYKEAEDILLNFVGDTLWQEKTYFLLGRLYKEQGSFDKAEKYLRKYAEPKFLLKDYTLKLLTDIYIAKEEFDKALEAARQIQNKTLLQKAKQSEITALLALKQEETLVKVLSQYIKEYPMEWDPRFLLAQLLKNIEKDKAISLFKDLYINATPLAGDALKELKAINADTFTLDELLRRADSLFEKSNFQRAEEAYREILKKIDNSMRDKPLTLNSKLLFSIGMCQFRQKRYNIAAKNFGLVESPEAMFWQAKALYRIDDIEGFNGVIRQFERVYAKDRYLAELLLILADEKRRTGELNEAEEIFKRVLNEFPERAENALWGLGWMNYTNGNYKKSEKNFSKLTSFTKSNGQYLYWAAKSREMLSKDCTTQKINLNMEDGTNKGGEEEFPSENNICSDGGNDAYGALLQDTSYYGFLAKARLNKLNVFDKIEIPKVRMPEGETYKRIEMLKFVGMNKEAIEEIKMALKSTKGSGEFKYLGQMAIELGEYKSIIYMVEDIPNEEFLPFSYPLGFWDIVKDAAESRGVDPYLVVAMIREESRFDPQAVSTAGAVGLMQLMSFTAHRVKEELKIELMDNSGLYDVKKNIFIGTHYLSLLIKEFKDIPLAIAAYNAGENALKKWLPNSNYKGIEEFIEDIPYWETRNYVKKVLKSYWQYRAMNGLPIEGF
jgi:soluble lytic murein transglycosylase